MCRQTLPRLSISCQLFDFRVREITRQVHEETTSRVPLVLHPRRKFYQPSIVHTEKMTQPAKSAQPYRMHQVERPCVGARLRVRVFACESAEEACVRSVNFCSRVFV